MRVVVVGAGLAGLRATERLLGAGCSVSLIEAGNRIGGRVRTVREPFDGGQYAESGAEWVDDVHVRMLAALDQYGIRRLGPGERWTTIRRWIHRNGELLGPDAVFGAEPTVYDELAEFEGIVESAAAGIDNPAHPDLHPEATRLDAQSLADVADRANLGELARLFKRRDAQGEFASEPTAVSLLFVAQQRAYQRDESENGEVLSHRVEGGFSRLAAAIGDGLASMISLGEQVLSVEQTADEVLVRTSRRVLVADHVVLACSLVPLRQVSFLPLMPPPLAAAVHELGYGTVTKTSVQWPTRNWPKGYTTSDGPAQRVYEPTVDQPGQHGILMSYCGGDGGHQWARMPEPERIALAASEMRAMHRLADGPMNGFSRAWSIEARYGGAYAVYEPGQVTAHWNVLRQAWGRVHLAGEHVATCTGYMEGALESGETVAARILEGA